jgi:hypothetical protein
MFDVRVRVAAIHIVALVVHCVGSVGKNNEQRAETNRVFLLLDAMWVRE